jgi:soluble lytic murein transglycosylase-like protein
MRHLRSRTATSPSLTLATRLALLAPALWLALALVAAAARGQAAVSAPPPSFAATAAAKERPAQAAHSVERVVAAEGRRLDAEQRRDLVRAVLEAERRHDLPALLVLAMIHCESRFDPAAEGPRGSLGLMQIKPSVAEEVARHHDLDWRGAETLLDPAENVRIGTSYLARLVRRFDGDQQTALAAYNRGPTRVEAALSEGVVPGRDYVERILARWEHLRRHYESAPGGI